jgi:hypothetical protein
MVQQLGSSGGHDLRTISGRNQPARLEASFNTNSQHHYHLGVGRHPSRKRHASSQHQMSFAYV